MKKYHVSRDDGEMKIILFLHVYNTDCHKQHSNDAMENAGGRLDERPVGKSGNGDKVRWTLGSTGQADFTMLQPALA